MAGVSDSGVEVAAMQARRRTTFFIGSASMLVAILRIGFFWALLYSLNRVVDVGTSLWLLAVAAALGVSAASVLAHTRLRALGFVALMAVFYAALQLFLGLVGLLPATLLPGIFGVYVLELHLDLAFAVLALSALSTWAFWRWRHALTLEVLLVGLGFVAVFSGHRNFHFERPQVVNSIAWYFGISPLWMLIVLGLALVGVLVLLLFVASWSGATASPAGIKVHRGERRLVVGSLFCLLVAAYLGVVAQALFKHFSQEALTRTANGVGQVSSEQVSPLGFHSALGGSNQPAAVVRLEGDYADNPFTPMLYLRESALSQFNGRELVVAGTEFDRDVSNTRPDESYVGQEEVSLSPRAPLQQSVYLLADHKLAFAVDYPLSLNPLKNPKPGTFKGAYRAYSLAPAFSLEQLKGEALGNPAWSEAERALYLQPHTDQRYAELARQIVGEGMQGPEQAFMVTDFLSKQAIYTLSPGHEVGPTEDPVAPFLFGDLRGYCVHFAHATVYMLRALGIPARIGTGYLTDLSESKDGHILLRMSDRHAWAEVYVEGKGWVPFDTKPEKVESHAESPVDMKLLEELMAMLGPGEEILPKDILKGEANIEAESEWPVPQMRHIAFSAAGILIFLALVKLFLLFLWLFPGSPASVARRSYISLAARLKDLGFERTEGETRLEFALRLNQAAGLELPHLARLVTHAAYSPQNGSDLSAQEVQESRQRDVLALSHLPRKRRLLGALNLSSAVSVLMGGRW